MSSFGRGHYLFVFEMKNGKQKLAYGETPEDALEILSYRLSGHEMAEILPDKYQRITQRKLYDHLDNLG
jgi:hypothetical protein